MADTFLDIVNENDEVIGQALRSEIHAKGLWHREAGVYFVTPKGEAIFQIRGANVERNANKASATAAGHVEQGMNYEETALAEMLEETGVQASLEELHYIYSEASDKSDGQHINRALRKVFVYIYKGKIEDLKVEDSFGAGFIACPIEKLLHPTDDIDMRLKKYTDPRYHEMYQKILELVR